MSILIGHRCGHCGGVEASGHIGNCEAEESDTLAKRCDELQSEITRLIAQSSGQREALHYCRGFISGLEHENKEAVIKTIDNYIQISEGEKNV